MKQTTIGKLKNDNIFYRSKRMKVLYKIVSKKKGQVTFTSEKSNKSFVRPESTVCYV